MTTLRVQHLAAGFGDHEVVTDISFEAAPGEIVTILGSSGSGKTTVLRSIAGLHRTTRGRVLLGDLDVTRWPAERRRVGLVPQEGALFPHRDVAANVGYGVRRRDRRTRVGEMLELVGLADRAAAMPHELSGGQRQRVALARALAPAPPVLLLDEPFSSLDAALRESLRMEFARIVAETSTAAVLVTHDVAEALTMSDRIVALSQGRVLATGTPADLYERPPSREIAEKLGPATLLPAQPAGPDRMATALGPVRTLPSAQPAPERALVLLRPEQARLRRAHDPTAPGGGRVVWSQFRGECNVVNVALESGPSVMVRTGTSIDWKAGDIVVVDVDDVLHVLPG